MNEELLRHQIEEHENTLNDHTKRLEYIEQQTCTINTKIENLCDQLDRLVQTIKWAVGIVVTISIFVLGFLVTK